jgi:hypothetical protein
LFSSGSLNLDNEHHWLVDFAVGRDLGIGNKAEVTFGVRVADLYSRATGNVSGGTLGFTPPPTPRPILTGLFSGPYSQTSEYLGVGPRLGLDGSVPLGAHWTLDWLVGAAALFGDSRLNTVGFAASPHFPTVSFSSSPTVFNVDGQAGLSYWLYPGASIMFSYRADAYFGALKTFNATGAVVNIDRVFNGPMLRFTIRN